MHSDYLFDISVFLRAWHSGEIIRLKEKAILSKRLIGLLTVYCICGIPTIIAQLNPNFKIKWYWRSLPLLSLFRNPSSAKTSIEKCPRSNRIYINIGSLPFHDNRSGIPRIAKKLSEEGLRQKNLICLPVYADPRNGIYRIAYHWCDEQGWTLPAPLSTLSTDQEITVQAGDWLVHTMINPNELLFCKSALDSFRENGGKIASILCDIIAKNHPEFFRPRDVKIFDRWLQFVSEGEAVFTISQTTKDAYETWFQKTYPKTKMPFCRAFHLGCDVRASRGFKKNLASFPALSHRDYFLQVSTIEPRKGHQQVLDACERLWSQGKDFCLVFVGRQGWMVRNLCRRIKHHEELGKRLFWLQGLDDEKLCALYANAKAIVAASKDEGFGLPLVEGLAYGKDVIARDIPVFREVGKDAPYYFHGESPEALASVMASLLENSQSKKTHTAFIPVTWKESFHQFRHTLEQFSKTPSMETSDI